MNFTSIQQALDARLEQVAELPTLYTENSRVLIKTGTPWTRTTLLPAETQALTTATDNTQGLYQIDLFYPNDQGYLTASAVADAVLALFPRGLVLEQSGLRIHVRGSSRLTASPFEQFFNVPVVVRWACLQSKG